MPRKTLIFLGTILVLAEVLSLPQLWKTSYAIFVGVVILVIAFKSKSDDISEKVEQGETEGLKKLMEGESLEQHVESTE